LLAKEFKTNLLWNISRRFVFGIEELNGIFHMLSFRAIIFDPEIGKAFLVTTIMIERSGSGS